MHGLIAVDQSDMIIITYMPAWAYTHSIMPTVTSTCTPTNAKISIQCHRYALVYIHAKYNVMHPRPLNDKDSPTFALTHKHIIYTACFQYTPYHTHPHYCNTRHPYNNHTGTNQGSYDAFVNRKGNDWLVQLCEELYQQTRDGVDITPSDSARCHAHVMH